MIKYYFKAIFVVLMLGFFFGTINFIVVKNLPLYNPIKEVYLFNYFITIISLFILFVIKLKFNDKVGFASLGLGILKMAVSVVYLMPLIDSNFLNKIPDTLSFFSAYFIFLIIESVIVIKLLNKKNY